MSTLNAGAGTPLLLTKIDSSLSWCWTLGMSEIRCHMCGRISDPGVDGNPPLAWMLDQDARGRRTWTCDACAAANVRSIEAKLDAEWW